MISLQGMFYMKYALSIISIPYSHYVSSMTLHVCATINFDGLFNGFVVPL